MSMVIVPNQLRDAIYAEIDAKAPKGIDSMDRDVLYKQLLIYYDEHGVIPDFTIERARALEGEE